jgi:hypothetical protein
LQTRTLAKFATVQKNRKNEIFSFKEILDTSKRLMLKTDVNTATKTIHLFTRDKLNLG